MSHLKLYKHDWTPPSQAVMMVADVLDIPITLIDIHLTEGDHMTPDFLKKNPLHSVPVLEDGDFFLADSHAIVVYLATVYGKDNTLCPKTPKERAILDQRLHFDNGIIYQRLRNVTVPIWNGMKKSEIKQFRLDEIEEGYGFLETYLNTSEWLAGDHMTVADLCTVATLSCSDMVVPVDRVKYPKISAWRDKLAALPYYKSRCEPGQRGYAEFFKTLLKKNEGA